LFQELTGLPARALPAGELVMYPEVAYTKAGHTLLVAVSRSGETTETLLAVEAFQRRRAGKAIALTNYGASPLASLSPFCLVVSAGQEVSVAQTRSFSSLYVACIAITCLLAGRQDFIERLASLPAVGSRLIARYEELARSLGGRTDLDRFYFLGSGPRYGLACESSLKIKEMTLTHSEPFHFLEFRHGPKAMVGQDTLVVGLLSTAARGYEEAVLREMQELGAEVLSLGEGEAMINFESGLPESVRNVLYLPILQLFACYRAAGKATSTRGRGAPQIDLCLTSTWS
jgi:glucosamine--fructose-6-phosphate aminotransferase (isomerizing)